MAMKSESETPEKLWTQEQLAEHIGVHPKTITRWVESGDFPQPIRLGRRVLRWQDATINKWLQKQGGKA